MARIMTPTLPASRDARPRGWVLYLRQHHRCVLVAVLLTITALALDIVVWLHPAPLPGDVGTTLWLQHLLLPHRTLTFLLDQPSELTWPLPATITTVAVVGLLLLMRRWLDAVVLAVIPALDSGATYLTTLLVQRPRPMGNGLHVQLLVKGYYSYPSGHVAHAVAFFGLLVVLTYRLRRPGWWVWPLQLALVALIVLMGPSRLLEGEHWLSDVVAGYLYGAFWLLVGLHAFDALARRWPRLLASGETAGGGAPAPRVAGQWAQGTATEG